MKETKDYVKNWSIETIIGHAFSEGMKFMAKSDMTNEDTEKKILVDEIEKRIAEAYEKGKYR